MTTPAPEPTLEREVVDSIVVRHWIGLTGTALRVVLIAAALGVIWAFIWRFVPNTEPWRDLAGILFWVLCAGIAGWLLLGRFRDWASPTMTITNHRVQIRYRRRANGWEIPLATIVDVEVRSGPLQRLLRVGNVSIRTNFAPAPAVMLDVARARLTAESIAVLRNSYWQRYAWSRAVSGQAWSENS